MGFNPFPAWAVALAISIPIVWCPAIIAATIVRLYGGGPKKRPITWGLTVLYLLFMYYDRKTPERNPRTSSWARSMWIWPNGRKYFRGTFHKHVNLRRDRTYLFGMHPHGVFCFSVWVNYLNNRNAFRELRHTRLATISNNFVTPILRDVMMSLGFIPATKEALTYTLKHDQSTALIIGGASEAQLNSDDAVRLILHTRLGFVRISLESDAPTVPIIHLQENHCYETPLASTVADCNNDNNSGEIRPKKKSILSNGMKTTIQSFQQWFLKTFTFSIPIFFGRAGTPLPRKIHSSTVTGDVPIDFRVLTEFYYFLISNALPICFTPQCPLGMINIPHQHVSGALDKCYCKMYSKINQNDLILNLVNNNNNDTDKNENYYSNNRVKPLPMIRPYPLTFHTLAHQNNAIFPLEYHLQQATIDNYEEILNSLKTNSHKKQLLLQKISKYNKKNEKVLQELQLEQAQNEQKQIEHYSQQRPSSHIDVYKVPQPRGLLYTDHNPNYTINKPCFVQEDVYIPLLSPQQRNIIISTIAQANHNTESHDNNNNNNNNTRNSHNHTIVMNQTTLVDLLSSNNNNVNNDQLAAYYRINWTYIHDTIVSWLLKIYIGELYYTYCKYNDDNITPMELADFNFVQFCTNECGIVMYDNGNTTNNNNNDNNNTSDNTKDKGSKNTTTTTTNNNNNSNSNNKDGIIPLELLSKYKNGIDVGDYLQLYGHERGLMMALLGVFLDLKMTATASASAVNTTTTTTQSDDQSISTPETKRMVTNIPLVLDEDAKSSGYKRQLGLTQLPINMVFGKSLSNDDNIMTNNIEAKL